MGLKQYGGTFWLGTGLASQFIVGMDKDPSGLSHWVSCTLSGQSDHKIHVVFGYHPCLNSLSCLRSVYAQHKQYFSSIGHSECPRLAFFFDLAICIQAWHAKGDEVLLFADFNGDICHPEVSQFTSSCGLHKCILSHYLSLPPLATFHHGDWFGSSLIDGAWSTKGIFLSTAALYPVDHLVIIGPFWLIGISKILSENHAFMLLTLLLIIFLVPFLEQSLNLLKPFPNSVNNITLLLV